MIAEENNSHAWICIKWAAAVLKLAQESSPTYTFPQVRSDSSDCVQTIVSFLKNYHCLYYSCSILGCFVSLWSLKQVKLAVSYTVGYNTHVYFWFAWEPISSIPMINNSSLSLHAQSNLTYLKQNLHELYKRRPPCAQKKFFETSTF